MSGALYRVRPLREHDTAALRSFVCADGAISWQMEVQEHIRLDLSYWAHAPGAQEDDPRVLLLIGGETDELIGVAAHEREGLITGTGEVLPSTRLHVVALAGAWHGRAFPNGERASDVLMSAALQDIATRRPPRSHRVHAFVHQDNVLSRILCRRHGLSLDYAVEAGPYRRLSTPTGPPD